MFWVSKPIPYRFTFVNGHGDAKLVACWKFSHRKIFLVGWNARDGIDSEACAVQLFERGIKKITFQRKFFNDFQEFFNPLVISVPNTGVEDGDEGSNENKGFGDTVQNKENEGNDTSDCTGAINMGQDTTTTAAPAPAPVTALITAPQTAKRTAIKFTIAQHIYGAKTVPQNIIDTLVGWHRAHPNQEPPCFHQDRPYPKWPWSLRPEWESNNIILNVHGPRTNTISFYISAR